MKKGIELASCQNLRQEPTHIEVLEFYTFVSVFFLPASWYKYCLVGSLLPVLGQNCHFFYSENLIKDIHQSANIKMSDLNLALNRDVLSKSDELWITRKRIIRDWRKRKVVSLKVSENVNCYSDARRLWKRLYKLTFSSSSPTTSLL